MDQFGMQPELEEEKEVKHNIFSSENYGIGRLEFLGASVLIVIVLYALVWILGIIFASIGMDLASTKIFATMIYVVVAIYLFTMNFAHRMFHIGWTDELNSRAIAGMIALVLCLGSCIPIINIFFTLVWIGWFLTLLFVPGDNE